MKFKDYKNLMFNLRMFDDPDPADEAKDNVNKLVGIILADRKAVTPMDGKDCECFVHSSFFVDFCGVVRNNNNDQQMVVYNPVRFCGKFRSELHLLSVGSMKLGYKRKRGSYYEAWNPGYGHDRQGHADRHP